MAKKIGNSGRDRPADRPRGAANGASLAASVNGRSHARHQSQDMDGLVRECLSQHLMRSPYLPPSLARTLATDIAATPVPVNGDRPDRSTPAGDDAAPDVGDATLSALRCRIVSASAALRARLIEGHDLPATLVDELIMHGQEKALTKVMASGFPAAEIEALATELSREQALTPTLLLRSLCLGELTFFESAMAALSATSVDRVHALIYEDGPHGFSQLYELAALPLGLFRAFRATIEVILQLGRETTRYWRGDFTDEIIQRLVKEYEQVCPEDLEHVLSQLSRRMREASPAAESPLHALA